MPYSNMTFTVSTGLAFVVNDFVQLSAVGGEISTTTTTSTSTSTSTTTSTTSTTTTLLPVDDFIVTENNDPLITEGGNNLIVSYPLPTSEIITEDGNFVITENGDNLTTQ